jgi:hypothetical protein
MRIFVHRILLALAVPIARAGCGGTQSTDAQVVSVSLATTPELKAAMELGSAQTLEKSRTTKQALDAYCRIVQEYPESPQARIAAEHLNALGSN